MSNVNAEIIKDSINPSGVRIATFVLTYPRFIHSEILTHRALSRNAASSRAIPFARMLDMVQNETAVPELWGRNKSGMQSEGELDSDEREIALRIWKSGMREAVTTSERLSELGLHKQIANRPLEPYLRYKALFTATDWDNFFSLRAHKDAQPEFQVLAYRMLNAYLTSVPKEKGWCDWHIPFEDNMPPDLLDNEKKIKVAIARCARISYMNFEGSMDVDKDLKLYSNLMEQAPLHASPAEHVAFADDDLLALRHEVKCDSRVNLYPRNEALLEWGSEAVGDMLPTGISERGNLQGNFHGWTQHRKLCPSENVVTADLQAIMDGKPDWITL